MSAVYTAGNRARLRRSTGVYAITDCDNLRWEQLLSVTEALLRAGIPMLQYRNKHAPRSRMKEQAGALRALCAAHDCLFIVNDDVRLAAEIGSDGVHLGAADDDCGRARTLLGDAAIIGVSCYNSLARAQAAAAADADYVAFGAFYPSQSKRNTVTARPDIIAQAKAALALPVVAIGGITPDNCMPLLRQGADLLAVLSSVSQAPDASAVAQRFKHCFDMIHCTAANQPEQI